MDRKTLNALKMNGLYISKKQFQYLKTLVEIDIDNLHVHSENIIEFESYKEMIMNLYKKILEEEKESKVKRV
tara:strand:- start:124 stop:339 length:216 start_codon:yes stop_codon:yes gene_type:complete